MAQYKLFAFADEAAASLDGQIAAMKRNGLDGLELRFVDKENVSAFSLEKAKSIKKEELLCYEDLGTEAVRRYTVEDFPCIVAIDSEGNNVYETEPVKYREVGSF